jgi:translation initiation factor 5
MSSDTMVPILKDTKDPHYRYKMPKLTTKVEGSGNGIKTVITNMTAVAKALDRPPTYPTKYFGCELGAQVSMNTEYIINGMHDPDKLMNLLYAFIRKFVLCAKCNNPETTLTVSNQSIGQKCIACGHKTTIPKAIHKLTTYIINNPPESNGKESSSSKKEKESKSKSKSKKSSSDKTSEVHSNSPDNNNGEDDFGEEDFGDDDFGNEENSLNDKKVKANIFYNLVKEKKEANQLTDENVQKELVKEADRLGIKTKSTLILSELLFSENMLEEMKTYQRLLLRFCVENQKSQKYLLGGFEKLVGDVYKDKLFDESIKILKQFYDEDILDEEVILEWASKPSKKYVPKEMSKKIHEKVEPFIKWLKEADIESDESDEEPAEKPAKTTTTTAPTATVLNTKKDTAGEPANSNSDEDDDLIDFSHRVNGLHIESVKPTIVPVNASNGQEEEGDDIDIDQI